MREAVFGLRESGSVNLGCNYVGSRETMSLELRSFDQRGSWKNNGPEIGSEVKRACHGPEITYSIAAGMVDCLFSKVEGSCGRRWFERGSWLSGGPGDGWQLLDATR